ncbi:MAG: hypothetical protein NTY36_12290 [Deltaproteobacteria bacterium]|nr:hypothetical protein [Deltaproteobacteria bacterium]
MQKITWQRSLVALVLLAGIVLTGARPVQAADAGAVFTPGPPMQVARELFNMAALPGGQVAVFGGRTYPGAALAKAEIWDPASNLFTSYNMNFSHHFSDLAKLADGDFLLLSGEGNNAETFHPGANTFTPTAGHPAYARIYGHAATLSSGKVLVVGGNSLDAATYGEVFDPATGTFTPTLTLHTPRALPLVLPCNDGSAVVLGGRSTTDPIIEYERVELYDPVSNSFSILQEQLFPGDPGWGIMGYVWGNGVYYLNPVETQRLQDGRYLLLAKKGLVPYTLFTFDPATKAIAKFTTTPDFPDYTHFALSCYPVVDAARNKAYLLNTDNHSGGFINVRLYTVDLATGRRNDPTGSFHLGSFLNEFGVTLLADGRLFLAGGDEVVNLAVQSTNKTWFIKPTGSPVRSMGLLLLD